MNKEICKRTSLLLLCLMLVISPQIGRAETAKSLGQAVSMSSYKDVTGDRHKDGTRSDEITQGANVLIVTKHSTDGHFDLLLKNRTGHWHRMYRWSTASASYRPVKVERNGQR